jgi:hypothetical protein
MINSATSWFKIKVLPVSQLPELAVSTGKGANGQRQAHPNKQTYFAKSSATLVNLMNGTWFSHYLHSQ